MKSPSVAKPRNARPLRLAAEDGVHQVAELVKEGDHVGVLQQAGVAVVSAGEVADERGLGQSAAAHAGDDGRGGEPLVLALAGVHVEIEAADRLAAVEDIEDRNGGVPAGRGRAAELDLEQPRGGLQHARLHLRVGKVGTHGVGVEVEGRAAELLVPVGAAGDVDGREAGLAPAGEVEDQLVLAACAVAAGLVQPGQKRAHVGRRAHHLVGGGQVGPTAEAENRGDLLPRGQQLFQNLLVGRVSAGVIGQEHALAQGSTRGKGHHRLHVGLVGRSV